MKVILMAFTKIFCPGKWAILGPKVVHPHNSGSVLSIAQRMELMVHGVYINMIFLKKFLLGANGLFRPRMAYRASQLWIHCKGCFTILHNKKHQERLIIGSCRLITETNYIIFFLKEILFRAIWSFWNKNCMASS